MDIMRLLYRYHTKVKLTSIGLVVHMIRVVHFVKTLKL